MTRWYTRDKSNKFNSTSYDTDVHNVARKVTPSYMPSSTVRKFERLGRTLKSDAPGTGAVAPASGFAGSKTKGKRCLGLKGILSYLIQIITKW